MFRGSSAKQFRRLPSISEEDEMNNALLPAFTSRPSSPLTTLMSRNKNKKSQQQSSKPVGKDDITNDSGTDAAPATSSAVAVVASSPLRARNEGGSPNIGSVTLSPKNTSTTGSRFFLRMKKMRSISPSKKASPSAAVGKGTGGGGRSHVENTADKADPTDKDVAFSKKNKNKSAASLRKAVAWADEYQQVYYTEKSPWAGSSSLYADPVLADSQDRDDTQLFDEVRDSVGAAAGLTNATGGGRGGFRTAADHDVRDILGDLDQQQQHHQKQQKRSHQVQQQTPKDRNFQFRKQQERSQKMLLQQWQRQRLVKKKKTSTSSSSKATNSYRDLRYMRNNSALLTTTTRKEEETTTTDDEDVGEETTEDDSNTAEDGSLYTTSDEEEGVEWANGSVERSHSNSVSDISTEQNLSDSSGGGMTVSALIGACDALDAFNDLLLNQNTERVRRMICG